MFTPTIHFILWYGSIVPLSIAKCVKQKQGGHWPKCAHLSTNCNWYTKVKLPGLKFNFDPSARIWTILVKFHYTMPYAKYLTSSLWQFRGKFLLYTYTENLWPPGRGQFWRQGYNLNNFGRGPIDNIIYQISKL
jgi:hypothetical protein